MQGVEVMPKVSVEVPAELLADLDERHGRLDPDPDDGLEGRDGDR